ncbi:trace amine-associated receptor 13c-like [Misgurnus anguillicaudatus]|uniref:trace amine-associated receptor 13c-like n=1 Tax=Misgurnus anguillicaudatus TaxID=75329 RepID=UPI003CCFB7D6
MACLAEAAYPQARYADPVKSDECLQACEGRVGWSFQYGAPVGHSCIAMERSTVGIPMYLLAALPSREVRVLSVWTVFLNLLVIISICHFKKLHTPTNMLILSLAVTDLLVGLIAMPLEAILFIETCWYFGETICRLFLIIMGLLTSTSLCNLVLIAVDRYVAVCHPLLYPKKITMTRTIIIICVSCGKHLTEGSVRRKSESKAALTLGIIVTVFLFCWIPYFISSLIQITGIASTIAYLIYWMVYINSGSRSSKPPADGRTLYTCAVAYTCTGSRLLL